MKAETDETTANRSTSGRGQLAFNQRRLGSNPIRFATRSHRQANTEESFGVAVA